MIGTIIEKSFSIRTWYEQFKHLTIETKFFDLSPDFINYILEDRLILPDDDFENNSDSYTNYEDDIDLNIKKFLNSNLFQDIHYQLRNILNYFNNAVFVKNNWHSPKDAKWICRGRCLKVESVNDLLLLIKSSEIIRNDFRNNIEMPTLALRKWINIHPAAEFRCIVYMRTLVGISPRDWPTFYEHFDQNGSEIIADIETYFLNNIKKNFSHHDNYVMDLIRPSNGHIILVDFGPLNNEINLHAFEYNEIINLSSKKVSQMKPVFRYLEKDVGIGPKHLHNPIPEDLKNFINNMSFN